MTYQETDEIFFPCENYSMNFNDMWRGHVEYVNNITHHNISLNDKKRLQQIGNEALKTCQKNSAIFYNGFKEECWKEIKYYSKCQYKHQPKEVADDSKDVWDPLDGFNSHSDKKQQQSKDTIKVDGHICKDEAVSVI